MEPVQDIHPVQKRMYFQMLLTMLVAAAVAFVLHKPEALIMMFVCSWTVSILTFGQPGYVRITGSILFMGIFFYVMYRVVFHAA